LAHYTLLVSPEMATITEMGIVISMSVIGGLGTFIGPVLGGVSLNLISEYVKEFGNYHLMVFGLILVLVMRFSPMGIAGVLASFASRKRKEKSVKQLKKEV
jgi:branched-chain amino acid transport system permease protein